MFFQGTTRRTFLVFLLLALSACSSNWKVAQTAPFTRVGQNAPGCKNVKAQFFDSLYTSAESGLGFPTSSQLHEAMKNVSDNSQSNDEAQIQLDLEQAYNAVLASNFNDEDDELQFLAQVEVGSEVSMQHFEVKRILDHLFTDIAERQMSHPNLTCQNSSSSEQSSSHSSSQSSPSANSVSVEIGARQVFATAYQTCNVLNLPPMTVDTPATQGVGLVSSKGAATGSGRFYQDLGLIQKTHYYVKEQKYGPHCYPVIKTPLVYNFGGFPKMQDGRMNLFENSGHGGPALGIDCSAFINTSIEHAGAKFSTKVDNRLQFLHFDSNDFIDPQKSGLTCFDRVVLQPHASVSPGDIVAIHGHVLMIDEIGADPFHLNGVSAATDCDHLDFHKFDIVFLQSAAIKGSVGIDRFRAADYLFEVPEMRPSVMAYAKAACLAKVTGRSQSVTTENFGIVRHRGTDDCKGQVVEMTNQECVQSCEFK